jgi:transcription elongation factor S-II
MSHRRQIFIEKLSKFLDLEVDDVNLINIEKGVFNNAVKYCKNYNLPLKWTTKEFIREYSSNARKILANISYTRNYKQFKQNILDGKYEYYDIVNLTHEQMDPEYWASIKINNMNKHISSSKEEVADGIFTCNACKSKKTVYYQMQTRSADEPMTTYVTCTNCNKKWKC